MHRCAIQNGSRAIIGLPFLMVMSVSMISTGFFCQHAVPPELLAMRKPINLTLAVKDQYDKAVPDYSVKVVAQVLEGPDVEYMAKTDKDGIARLVKPSVLAYSIRLVEVDDPRFTFNLNKEGTPLQTLDEAPTTTLYLAKMPDDRQDLQLRVAKHGATMKGELYYPESLGSTGSVVAEPGAINQFTFDLPNNKLVPGLAGGTFRMTVRNAKEALKLYGIAKSQGKAMPEAAEYSVSFEALGDSAIQPADMDIATYAPEDGYKKSISYKFIVAGDAPPGVAPLNRGCPVGTPAKSSVTGDEYAFYSGQFYIYFGFYVKTKHPSRYYLIKMSLEPSKDGELALHASGFCNPDGSNNLWMGSKMRGVGH